MDTNYVPDTGKIHIASSVYYIFRKIKHKALNNFRPEEGSEQYHIFEVHLVSEHIWCDDYLVRSFYLKNTRTGETRTVTQFHFQSWPAHGVPSSTKALLEFRRKVNKSYRGRACPIVVHCRYDSSSFELGTLFLILSFDDICGLVSKEALINPKLMHF